MPRGAKRRLGPAAAAAATLLLVLGAAEAAAHVVFARGSLRQFLQHSALSVRAEFLAGPLVAVGPGGDRQEYFRVRVLERLAGAGPEQGELDFFPHAEGFPGFAAGDQALLFLERTAARPEFAPWAERLPWFSVQGAGEEWVLAGEPGRIALAWARELAGWLDAGGDDVAGLRELLARGLRSGVAALQGDALLELMRGRSLPGLLDTAGAVAEIAPAVDDPRLSLGRRAALYLLLEGHPGFAAEAHLERLVGDADSSAQRRVLARQLAGSSRADVQAWIAGLAADPDPQVRRAAVAAQAQRGREADLALLERALDDPEAGVARAAIRALGALEDPAARALLARVAAGDDSRRALWATAELRRDAGASVQREKVPAERF